MIMHQLIKIQENILLISFAVIKLYRIVFSFDNFETGTGVTYIEIGSY